MRSTSPNGFCDAPGTSAHSYPSCFLLRGYALCIADRRQINLCAPERENPQRVFEGPDTGMRTRPFRRERDAGGVRPAEQNTEAGVQARSIEFPSAGRRQIQSSPICARVLLSTHYGTARFRLAFYLHRLQRRLGGLCDDGRAASTCGRVTYQMLSPGIALPVFLDPGGFVRLAG